MVLNTVKHTKSLDNLKNDMVINVVPYKISDTEDENESDTRIDKKGSSYLMIDLS